MNTKELLESTIKDLEQIEIRFTELASRSEFEEKRNEFLNYNREINKVKQQLKKDVKMVTEYETYTSSLDRI